MNDNTAAVILGIATVIYRLICMGIATYAAINGIWWFAVVMVLVALLASYHFSTDGKPKKE